MQNLTAAALTLAIGAATLTPAYAQRLELASADSGAADAGPDADAVDEVVVLGTAREDVTPLTSTAPVDVISSAQ